MRGGGEVVTYPRRCVGGGGDPPYPRRCVGGGVVTPPTPEGVWGGGGGDPPYPEITGLLLLALSFFFFGCDVGCSSNNFKHILADSFAEQSPVPFYIDIASFLSCIQHALHSVFLR